MFLLDLICLFLLLRRDLIVLIFVPVRQIYVQSYRQKNTRSTNWMCLKFVSNKGKKRISKRNVISKESTSNLSEKHFLSLVTHVYTHVSGVRNCRFSGNLACFCYLRFWDSYFCRGVDCELRGVFTAQSNIYDGAFFEKELRHRCSAGFSILTMTFLLSILNHFFTVIYCFCNGFK